MTPAYPQTLACFITYLLLPLRNPPADSLFARPYTATQNEARKILAVQLGRLFDLLPSAALLSPTVAGIKADQNRYDIVRRGSTCCKGGPLQNQFSRFESTDDPLV